MPDNPLILQAVKYRYRLDAMSSKDMKRLVDAYKQLSFRLRDKIDLLVAELQANPGITRGQLVRLSRYKDLMRAVADELQRYNVYLETELGTIANAALSQSVLDMRSLMRLSAARVGAVPALNALPTNAIKTLLGFLQPDGKLYKHIQSLAPETTQLIADKIVEGVALGYNPVKVGNLIVDNLGMGLTSAMRLARTTQMWTYREASRATMLANAEVVDGWVWFAILDDSVPPCESCLANHGKLFGLDEVLDDHFNGRCVAIPHVIGDDNPVDMSGEEWFNSLPEDKQAEVLGASKLSGYNDGRFTFDQLTQQVDDPIFGTMRTGVPLKNLIDD